MPIQRTRFHSAIQPPPEQTLRTEILEPILGINKAQTPANLRPGETPACQNFIVEDRFLRPRGGVTLQRDTSSSSVPLGYVFGTPRTTDAHTKLLFTASPSQISMLLRHTITATAAAASWSRVSSLVVPSARTDGYWSATVLKGATPGSTTFPATIAVHPFIPPGHIGISGSSFLTLEEFYSIGSYARYCTAFDDRTILFHSGQSLAASDISNQPTRVSWTGRGSLTSFAIGGFQDLIDMQGDGTGVVADRDRMILTSEHETWAGRPRRDAYAFDFFALDKTVGCPKEYERTLAHTDAGPIWLGKGFEFRRVVGNEVRTLGRKVREMLKDEMREWSHCWALFSPKDHTYQFYYSDTTGEYPTKALFLRTDTISAIGADSDDGVWMPQDFGTPQFTVGGHFLAPGFDQTLLFRNTGTENELTADGAQDIGTAMDCRWRSHALRAERDRYPYEALQECWFEYEYDSATTSTVSLFQSTDNGATFNLVSNASLTSGVNYNMIPVAAQAARNQMLELRIADGTKPRIAGLHLKLRGYTGRHSG